jgi:glucosamine--fructose-6-phosphate aminotransferase (isomerizing)
MKSLGNFPDPFIAEIAGQPDALRRAAAGLRDQRSVLEELAALTDRRSVVLTGMGSSYDACYPAVADLAAAGVAAVMVDTAELLHFRAGMLGGDTVLVIVSQSGESAEVVRLVEDLGRPDERPTIVAITNGTRNSLWAWSDHAFDTRAGEEVGPSTMTFAASLVATGAAARVLAGSPPDVVLEGLTTEAERAAVGIEALLGDDALAGRLVSWLGERPNMVVLGRGPARAAAEMGALTIKEAAGIAVESLQTAQFRHGPLELAGPGLAVAVIATEPETSTLDLGLADELAATGAAVLVIELDIAASSSPAVERIEIGTLDRAVAPAVSILPLQLLAWRLAAIRGRAPGSYQRASKVTTHE